MIDLINFNKFIQRFISWLRSSVCDFTAYRWSFWVD